MPSPQAASLRFIMALAVLAAGAGPAAGQAARPEPACARNGCLRDYRLVGAYPRTALAPYAEPGVRFDNGYRVYRIRFFTNGREATGTVTVPFDPGLQPPAGGWHIVANNHGTIGLDDPCAVGAGSAGVGLAGYFGARGLIGVTADYPGLGTAGLHTYLDKESEGACVLDALRATRELAVGLGVPVSGRFAAAGLSQGGHATLGAATLKAGYAPELDIRAFAAAGPASAWEEHWSLAVQYPGWHIAVQAMLLYSWSRAYGWKDLPLWTDAMAARVDQTMTRLCVFAPSGPTLLSSVPADPAQVFHPELRREYRSRQWSRYRAVHAAFEKNAVRGFVQTAPVRIYQGAADAIVPEAATRQMVDALRQSGVSVDYVGVPEGQHTDVAFHFLASRQLRTDEAVAWIRGLLDRP